MTVGVLFVAEREFRSWVAAQVMESFERGVDGLLEARRKRLADTKVRAEALAQAPEVKAAIRGELDATTRQSLIRRYRELAGQAENPAPARPGIPGESTPAVPVMGVADMAGQIRFFGPAAPRLRHAKGGPRPEERLRDPDLMGETIVGYGVVDDPGPEGTALREVVLVPVRDGGRGIGWFFLGRNALTAEDRAFERMGEASGRDVRSGLVIDGTWYVGGVAAALAEELDRGLDDDFWQGGKPRVVEAEGADYLLMARELNPGSPLGKGVQIGVFPLARLAAAIHDLRTAVAAAGLFALGITALVAWWLARRFSSPIHALVEATERVREGDFEGQVIVRSKDELGLLAREFNEMTRGLGLKEKYHDLLGKTSDPAVARRLMDGSLELGGEVREAAVIFCDIRGFTAMTDGMAPPRVIALLNEHMTAMNRIIHAHGGVVDKFVGDLVMAVFGAPVGAADDLERAAACAVAMMRERQRLNRETGKPVEIGIGLAGGEVVAGLMGSEERLNYTVLGDRVNLASRLCSMAAAGDVLVDGASAVRLRGKMAMTRRGTAPAKGFRDEIEVWELGV